MWLRWRRSKYTLHPWNYMTNGKTYADDMIDMECLEAMARQKEIEQEHYEQGLEESRRNRDSNRIRMHQE